MTKEEVAQFYLDAQGYIVIWSEKKRVNGEVIDEIAFGQLDAFEHPLVVIGAATREEYLTQCALLKSETSGASKPFFHKVTAE